MCSWSLMLSVLSPCPQTLPQALQGVPRPGQEKEKERIDYNGKGWALWQFKTRLLHFEFSNEVTYSPALIGMCRQEVVFNIEYLVLSSCSPFLLSNESLQRLGKGRFRASLLLPFWTRVTKKPGSSLPPQSLAGAAAVKCQPVSAGPSWVKLGGQRPGHRKLELSIRDLGLLWA